MSPLSTVPLTWADMWTRGVLHGSVNRPRINGMQEVRGSNPLSSTPAQRPCSARTPPDSPPSCSRFAATMNETCPHCLRDVRFDIQANVQRDREFHQIQRCQACGGQVYRMVDINEQGRTLAQWPLKGIRATHPAVPAPIAADWLEAHLCLTIRAFRGAAAMARRAVQGVAIDQGAKDAPLNAQLRELESKATLHLTMVEWADHIRLLGNVGAHPGADGLETVSEEEAQDVVRFLDELLRWLYELPAETAAARAARSTSTP
jgi:hypothetical protein